MFPAQTMRNLTVFGIPDDFSLLSSQLFLDIQSQKKKKISKASSTETLKDATHMMKTVGNFSGFKKKGKKIEKKTKTKISRIYFPRVAVSQFHPIMDQYCTFLFLTALSRDAVRSLKCSSSLFFFFPSFFHLFPTQFKWQRSEIRGD